MPYALAALLIVGFIACIAAMPFTGGATAFVAPFLFFAALSIPVTLEFAKASKDERIMHLHNELHALKAEKTKVGVLESNQAQKVNIESRIEELKSQKQEKGSLFGKDADELQRLEGQLPIITRRIEEDTKFAADMKAKEAERAAQRKAAKAAREKADAEAQAQAKAKAQAPVQPEVPPNVQNKKEPGDEVKVPGGAAKVEIPPEDTGAGVMPLLNQQQGESPDGQAEGEGT